MGRKAQGAWRKGEGTRRKAQGAGTQLRKDDPASLAPCALTLVP